MPAAVKTISDKAMGDERAAVAAAEKKPGRITSLDVARGLMLIASIVSSSFYLAPIPLFNQHAFWDEPQRVIDWIFPIFVTLSGCGLAFAYKNRVGWYATIKRSIVLLICGLLFNAVAQLANSNFSLSTLKFTGPLTLYAVLCLVVGLLHLRVRSWRSWFVFSLGLSTTYAMSLWLYAQKCAEHTLTRACNPSKVLDPLVFGSSHIYQQGAAGHDPEGTLVMIGALCSAAIGATIGHFLLEFRSSTVRERMPALILIFLSWSAAYWALAEVTPVMKRLWTPAFALQTSTATVAVLVVAYLLLDRNPNRYPAKNRIVYPLIALGRNSLLMYFGSHLAMVLLVARSSSSKQSVLEWLGGVLPLVTNQLVWSGLFFGAFLALAIILHRKKIYLRP